MIQLAQALAQMKMQSAKTYALEEDMEMEHALETKREMHFVAVALKIFWIQIFLIKVITCV